MRDYYTNVDSYGNDLEPAELMRCNDCDRPAYYDYDTEGYHHAVTPEEGCFLIPTEPDRRPDHHHPLVAQGRTAEARKYR